MKLSIRRTVAFASLAGTLALATAGVAFAGEGQGDHAGHHHGHREGLLAAALKLDSLTPEQRSSIDQLVQARRAAGVPVRQADARLLTQLAVQVEQANVDTGALQPSLNAERSAADAEVAVEKDGLARLHALLTPAQRDQVVASVEGAYRSHRHGDASAHRREHEEHAGKLGLTPEQRREIRTNFTNLAGAAPAPGHARGELRTALESFRGDAFDPASLVHAEMHGEFAERLAKAMVPVLTAQQRATFAGDLRARAAHEQN
jgi:Spy/CpxP family protein refolding chaperone